MRTAPSDACSSSTLLPLALPSKRTSGLPRGSWGIVDGVEDWDTSCLDWEERILDGRSLVPDLPLYEAEAARALRVFKRLRLPDVIGTPTMGEACGAVVFPDRGGAVRLLRSGHQRPAHLGGVPANPERQFSKSSNGGAVMLTAMIVNRRPEAEFLFIAPTMEIAEHCLQAGQGHDPARPGTDANCSMCRITSGKSPTGARGATLQIKAADTDVITGSKATGTMIDETHVFAKKATPRKSSSSSAAR